MRIVIDGTAGCGKSTFLGSKRRETNTPPNMRDMGAFVYAELIRSSLHKARDLGICPPSGPPDSLEKWGQLFDIMYEYGKEQYYSASDDGVFWYDRGVPFILSFAVSHTVPLPIRILDKLKDYKYDHVFVFEPIETYDLSVNPKGKLVPITLENRYEEHRRVCDIYSSLGHTVNTVPVYSYDNEENFNARLSHIERVTGMDFRAMYAS